MISHEREKEWVGVNRLPKAKKVASERIGADQGKQTRTVAGSPNAIVSLVPDRISVGVGP